ncbi:hypothetical protein D3C72_1773770 [compost metagenome]
MQPAILDGLGGSLGVLVVTGKYHLPLDLQLPLAAVVRSAHLAQPILHALRDGSNGAHHHIVQPVTGDHAGGFREAIDLDQRHTQHAKVAHHIGWNGGGAGERHLGLTQADEVLQRAKDQPVAGGKA